MFKEEKQSLTMDKIVRDLKFEARLERVDAVLVLGSLTMLFAVISLLLFVIGAYGFHWNPAVTVISMCVLWILWISYAVCRIRKLYLRARSIEKGNFSIVKDELVRIVEDEFNKGNYFSNGGSLGRAYEHVFYFDHYGRFVIDRDKTLLANCGEVFYLVVYNDQKDIPILIYNTKMYEYKDEK